MDSYTYLNYEVEDKVAVITINNPPANSLSTKVMSELDSAIASIRDDNGIKAAVITGSGSVIFVAGADIKEISTIESREEAIRLVKSGQQILSNIENLSKPVIAAINGLCLGGGNELAMACHMRISSDMTKFGQPEINLGIIPGFGGTQRLPRLVGKGKALEIILTGDMITAKEAYRIGLVDKIVPPNEVLKQAKGLAKRIIKKGMPSINAAVASVNKGLGGSLEDGLLIEAEGFGAICETDDMKEGIKAFLEKRQPKFTDR